MIWWPGNDLDPRDIVEKKEWLQSKLRNFLLPIVSSLYRGENLESYTEWVQ